jgi:hypothetical protein
MKAYQYDSETKKYIGEIERQIDPLESQAQGKEIWLMPADSTDIVPLEPKDGYDVVFNGTGWEYKETPKEPEPEPYVPTELEKKQQELWETEQRLRNLDYIGVKIATGRATIEEYAEEIAEMSRLADKVNQLRAEIKELENEKLD